jgi:hypothetical protein
MTRARRDTQPIPLPGPRKTGGKPRDFDGRMAVLKAHDEHPELKSHDAIAEFVSAQLGRPVSRRLVRSVLPPLAPPKGLRIVVPAELATWAGKHGGVIAVLEWARMEKRRLR